MSYRFVFGESGSGKTYKVMNDCISASIADESSRFLLIVPEQSTTAAEKEIVRLHPNHATDAIDVLSFNRLAYKVFEELGIENPEALDDISKAMILRKLAGEHKGELAVWKNRFDKPGFVDNLKSMISELYLYGIAPEDLKRASSDDIVKGDKKDGENKNLENMNEKSVANTVSIRPKLRNKLHDLTIMYEAFRNYIKDRFITIEEIPDILARVIDGSSLIKGATVVLDGFTGFTPIQYRIIESFLSNAKEVVFAVHIGDGVNPYSSEGPEDLFAMSRTMVARIIELGNRNGVSEKGSVTLEKRHELTKDDVMIGHAQNIAKEIEFTAFDIKKRMRESIDLCSQTESGEVLRYRQIAVICASSESYNAGLKHEFELSGIPYYLDEKIGIADNPLPMMISAALDCVTGDYSYESFMRYLKSGLVSDDTEMIDLVDNYMYQYGRRGYKRMRDDWLCEKDEKLRLRINEFKNSILDTLEELRGVKQFGDMPDAVLRLMDSLGVKDKLAARKEYFEQSGDAARAREYDKVCDRVTELLTHMGELLRGESINKSEFASIFETGIEQIKLGIIPSGADRVIIGDLTRTRLENIKLLYIIGANDGNLPKILNRGSVITDSEKEVLKRCGFELAPTVKDDLLNQRYYVYRMLTKPTEQLCVTFAGINEKGESMSPSCIIPEILDKYNAGIDNEEEKLKVTSAAADGVAVQIIEVTRGGETISEEAAESLYGRTLYASVTRLEKFMQCPYEFFAQYGLKLKNIEKYSLEAVDVGNIAHEALEDVFLQCRKAGKEITEYSDTERDELVSDCISRAILNDPSAKYTDSSKNRYIVKRVERMLQRSLWAMSGQLKEDEFTPYEFEWEFSFKDGTKSLNIDLEDGRKIGLSGKIDRVDINATGDDILVRIIDYKTGSKKWDIGEVAAGYDLQLVTYMDTVRELLKRRFPDKNIIPSSMYYYHVEDPIIELKDKNDDAAEELLKEMEPSGIEFDETHPAELLMNYIRHKSSETGERILRGDVAVSPRTSGDRSACSFCNFRSLCGFDRKLKGCTFRNDKIKNNEAWDVIGSVDETAK